MSLFGAKGHQNPEDSGKTLFLPLYLNLHWERGLDQEDSYYQKYLFTQETHLHKRAIFVFQTFFFAFL